MGNYNYNNSVELFKNYAHAYPTRVLQLIDGHIWTEGEGYIARCTDDAEAEQLLESSGYVRQEDGRYVPRP